MSPISSIQQGDCLVVLRGFSENSVDAVVTDPPYGLDFMGKQWDHGVPGVPFWREILRVAKPGAYLVAFGGTRTFHRLTCAIEDAGWEIRDCLMWLYGTGFPKSLDVSKAIDKHLGKENERPVVGVKPGHEEFVGRTTTGHITALKDTGGGGFGRPWMDDPEARERYHQATGSATLEAAKWEGWGTALKPGWEPIILARKPLIGTVAANVLEYGTGGINIDGCRIETADNLNGGAYSGGKRPSSAMGCKGEVGGTSSMLEAGGGRLSPDQFRQPTGRWPANVVLDEEAATLLDEQSGVTISSGGEPHDGEANRHGIYGSRIRKRTGKGVGKGDTGGASRFFYCAKASKSEREAGLEDVPHDVESRANDHPTVKPVALMRWLVRLVTPPGGLVVDPFAGSGTTGVACRLESMGFQGIEQNPRYCEVAGKRIAGTSEEAKESKESKESKATAREGKVESYRLFE